MSWKLLKGEVVGFHQKIEISRLNLYFVGFHVSVCLGLSAILWHPSVPWDLKAAPRLPCHLLAAMTKYRGWLPKGNFRMSDSTNSCWMAPLLGNMCSLLFGDVCSAASEFQCMNGMNLSWSCWPKSWSIYPAGLALFFSHHHRIGTKFDGQSWFWNAAPGCVIHLQPLPLLSNTFFHWLSCVYGPLWSPTAAQVVGPLLLHARWHTNSFCDVEHDNGMMTSWPLAQPLGEAWQDLCTWHWRAGTPSYL